MYVWSTVTCCDVVISVYHRSSPWRLLGSCWCWSLSFIWPLIELHLIAWVSSRETLMLILANRCIGQRMTALDTGCVWFNTARATGNSRFETEKFSAKNSRKFPLSIKRNYYSLCNISTLYTACISYVVFMGRDVGYSPSCFCSV